MSLLKQTKRRWNNAVGRNFTFHYVSIKTDYIEDNTSSNDDFTFHYVSIKTLLALVPDVAFETSLHSTMSLLKPG